MRGFCFLRKGYAGILFLCGKVMCGFVLFCGKGYARIFLLRKALKTQSTKKGNKGSSLISLKDILVKKGGK